MPRWVDPEPKVWLGDMPRVLGSTLSSLDPRLLQSPQGSGVIVGGVVVHYIAEQVLAGGDFQRGEQIETCAALSAPYAAIRVS